MPGLGFVYADDVRDHPFRGVVPPVPGAPAPKPRVRPWQAQASLDQIETSTCVGHGIKHCLMSAPIVDDPDDLPVDGEGRGQIVLLDEWPQNDKEATLPDRELLFGTSVRAGMKWLLAQGLIKEYVRCYSATTVQVAVKTLTTVPVGTNWTGAMFTPTPEGIVRYNGTDVRGGHCFLCHWYDEKRGLFLFQNSWGHTWGVDHPTQKNLKGKRGYFWIPGEDFERLMGDDAEAWAGVELRHKRVVA